MIRCRNKQPITHFALDFFLMPTNRLTMVTSSHIHQPSYCVLFVSTIQKTYRCIETEQRCSSVHGLLPSERTNVKLVVIGRSLSNYIQSVTTDAGASSRSIALFVILVICWQVRSRPCMLDFILQLNKLKFQDQS